MIINFLKQTYGNLRTKILWSRFGRIYTSGTLSSQRSFYNFMISFHKKEHIERTKYLNYKSNLINDDDGYLIFNYLNNPKFDDFKNLLEIYRNQYFQIEFDELSKTQRPGNSSIQKPYLAAVDFEKEIFFSKEFYRFIRPLVPIVTNYFGSLPIIQSAQFWYSPNQDNHLGGSQNWHRDGEDVKQLKVFIPVNDIGLENGPLNIISIKETNSLFEKLAIKDNSLTVSRRIDDKEMDAIGEKYNKIPVCIKKGEIAFVDTSNCYHYGSRKSKKSREVIVLHFTSAYSINTPIIKRKFVDYGYGREHSLIFGLKNQNFPDLRNKTKLKWWQIKIA